MSGANRVRSRRLRGTFGSSEVECLKAHWEHGYTRYHENKHRKHGASEVILIELPNSKMQALRPSVSALNKAPNTAVKRREALYKHPLLTGRKGCEVG